MSNSYNTDNYQCGVFKKVKYGIKRPIVFLYK